jgi:hypothetical protein
MKTFFLAAFFLVSSAAFADDAMVTINGSIVHDLSNPHSYQGEFVFKPESSVTIVLTTCMGPNNCYQAMKKSFTGISAFPIPFSLQVKKGVYALQVSVRSNGGAKEEVGDLVNEELIVVGKKDEEITVNASGLEACTDANSGGFCL